MRGNTNTRTYTYTNEHIQQKTEINRDIVKHSSTKNILSKVYIWKLIHSNINNTHTSTNITQNQLHILNTYSAIQKYKNYTHKIH